jgi:hypothetical protein
VFAIFGVELRSPIEIANLGRNSYREVRDIERLNPPYATLAGDQRVPEWLPSDPKRCDAAHAGDDDAPGVLKLPEHE